MSARAVRARRHEDGHVEFLEPVHLPKAPVFEVIINEPDDEPPVEQPSGPLLLGGWHLGVEPWTRADLYDEAV